MSEQTLRVPFLLKRFIDGIRKAEGAMQQMVHQHEGDPRYIALYQKLSLVKDKSVKIAMKATGVNITHGPA